MFDTDESVLQIVRTRVRSGWTEQDAWTRVEQGTRKSAEYGQEAVRTQWVTQNGRRQLQQINSLPNYQGQKSAIFLSDWQDFSYEEHPESCRVDRHFVEHGYYIQLIAVAYRVNPPYDRCNVAEEMAAWAAEHIQVGKGCGPASGRGE